MIDAVIYGATPEYQDGKIGQTSAGKNIQQTEELIIGQKRRKVWRGRRRELGMP